MKFLTLDGDDLEVILLISPNEAETYHENLFRIYQWDAPEFHIEGSHTIFLLAAFHTKEECLECLSDILGEEPNGKFFMAEPTTDYVRITNSWIDN